MRLLAIPFVMTCSLRSVFPDIYVSRCVWFDSWINSILLHRLCATIGELCWICQISCAVAWTGNEIRAAKSRVNLPITAWDELSKAAALALVGLIAFAECCSCTGTITTNSLFFFLEESSWVVAFTLMFPVAVYQFALTSKLVQLESDRIDWSAPHGFARILVVVLAVYVVWGWTSDVPSNYARWRSDVAHHKHHYGWWDGIVNAATELNVHHDWETWKPYVAWMTMYFSVGVWSSIALMKAPRTHKKDPHTILLNVSTDQL